MKRFHRAKDKQAVVDALCRNNKPFSQIWQVMMFSCCLGIKVGRREPLGDSDSSVAIPASVFSNNVDAWPGIAYLINLVETSDPLILTADEETHDKRITTLEEYANGGLAYLAERLEATDYSFSSICTVVVEHSLGPEPKAEFI